VVRFLRALRPTLLDRYVAREIVPPTGLGLLLFTFILLLDQISSLMKILVSRGADLSTVVRALLYILPSILSVTIPMAFLLGVLLAFGRLASESEIVALRASGISPARLLRPVMALAALAGMATFYVMAVALPAANQSYREIVFALIVSKAKTGVKPRVFTDEDLVPGMVLYVSDIPSESGRWKDVFVQDVRTPQKPRVILAKTGELVIEKGRKYVALELHDGAIHAFNADKPESYEETRFKGAAIFPLPFEQFFPSVPLAKGDREMGLADLEQKIQEMKAAKKTPKDWAPYAVEWHKKFAIAFACVVFGLLGLGLSLGSKKEARSAAFGLSIGVIFTYYVIIRLGEQAGDTGLVSPAVSMWSANVVLGAIALFLLFLNHRQAAFDPLDPSHYTALLPLVRRATRSGLPPRPRRVVVVRMPRWSLPLPGLLDRYIARTFLGHLALVLTSFLALFILGDFINLFDEIQQNHVKGVIVVHFYKFATPRMLHLLLPAALLVATLTTFGVLSRRNEMTAVKAGGVSLYRATLPVLMIGLFASVLMFASSELVLPDTVRISNQDLNVIKGRPPQSNSAMDRRWLLGTDGRLYNYEFVTRGPGPEAITLYGLSVYDLDVKAWSLHERLFARRAAWKDGLYELERGFRHTFGAHPTFEPFQQRRTREIDSPAYFKREEPQSDTLGYRALQRQIASLRSKGVDVVGLEVQLNKKFAYPMVAVVMTIIGIPFSFVVAKRGALYGIAASIVIAAVYWGALAVFEGLGNVAVLPPGLAAWTPDIVFGAAGLYLMLTLDT
jgi:LPS export ABC transporter permease LptF/LPS export ABC transporter permease LptG